MFNKVDNFLGIINKKYNLIIEKKLVFKKLNYDLTHPK